jgi:broad specificity phosphatase PhoE
LKRAVQTAEGMHAEADSDLVEYNYGDYEGLTTAQIRQGDPDWNLFKKGCPNGESLSDVAIRADRFLAKLHNVNGSIAIFSHGHFLRILAARFLGLNPEMGRIFSLSVASLSILGYEKNEPVITLWNGV